MRTKARPRPARLPGALLAATLAWARTGPAEAAPVRVFLVNHEVRIEDAVDVAGFRARLRALFDARARGPGLVQDGVDDVASRLRPRDEGAPALAVVHLPEDTGLVAALVGSRGSGARAVDSSTLAFASLLAPYGPVIDRYEARWPALVAQPIRGLVVALTDVLYRTVYETCRELAREHGVHLSVSLNAATARRVEASADPALVALLRGPDEPGRAYAWEATSDLPRNVVWLFEPSGEILVPDGRGGLLRSPSETGGEIRPSASKAYLTPIEQGLDKPGGGLSLAAGAVRDLDVLDTPVGAIGVVISKDAWMPDVNERLDAKGANFTLQSEAFSGWAFAARPWDPDVFKESGFGNLQGRAGFRFSASPSLVGNLFDVTFDGQGAILEKRREKPRPPRRTERNGWLGQLADSGFVAVAPWVLPDPAPPGSPGSSTSLAERRAWLAERGALLRPGSGVACSSTVEVGACEGGYRESVVFADLELPTGPLVSGTPAGDDFAARPVAEGLAPARFGSSFALAPGGPGRQRHPRVAADGDLVAIAWDDTADGPVPRVRLAISTDGGRSFSAPIAAGGPGALPGFEGAELLPDVEIARGEIRVAWQVFADALDDDSGAIALAAFGADGRVRVPVTRVDGGAALPGAGRWHPALATLRGGDPLVAWVDERDAGPDGVAFEHVHAARGRRTGPGFSFDAAVRVGGGRPVPLAEAFDDEWAPDVAVDREGRVLVAWVGFRDYSWDVWTARSTDEGASFAAPLRVNGGSREERICDAPHLLALDDGTTLLAWTDLRDRRPDTDVRLAGTGDGGASWSADRVLEDSSLREDPDVDVPSDQARVALATAGGRALAAWQDDREGNADLFFSPLGRGASAATSALPERLDDGGSGPSGQFRPDLAATGSDPPRCLAAWEDDRDGRLRIRVASTPCVAGTGPRLSVGSRGIPTLERR